MNSPAMALTVSGLQLSYGGLVALADINLAIPRGALTALIGANGAGKSSLVKAICGRMPIEKGSIKINGVDAASRAARAGLGVAPQKAALYDHLTAAENLTSFGRQAGLGKNQAHDRTREVLSLTGMSEAAKRRAGAMSGGMRQRINIGAAIMHQPALIILDEPAAGLDPAGLARINQLIAKLKEQKYGVLLITHDMDQAARLADNVIILHKGRIRAQGAPAQIIEELCGRRLTLTIDARAGDKNIAALRKNGFKEDAQTPLRFTKQIDNEAQGADEIAALTRAGVSSQSLTITAPGLRQALNAASNNAAHKEAKA